MKVEVVTTKEYEVDAIVHEHAQKLHFHREDGVALTLNLNKDEVKALVEFGFPTGS